MGVLVSVVLVSRSWFLHVARILPSLPGRGCCPLPFATPPGRCRPALASLARSSRLLPPPYLQDRAGP